MERLKKQILEMRDWGLTMKEIGQELGITRDQVKAALRTKKSKTNTSYRFDFNVVLEFFKTGKNKHDAVKEFTPDKNVFYYDAWRQGLTQEQKDLLNKYEKKRKPVSHVLEDLVIERKFEYVETDENTMLPLGSK